MSLEQYKDASRKELWDILQIQMQVLQAEAAKVAELEKENKELEDCFDDCYADLGKVQHELNEALKEQVK